MDNNDNIHNNNNNSNNNMSNNGNGTTTTRITRQMTVMSMTAGPNPEPLAPGPLLQPMHQPPLPQRDPRRRQRLLPQPPVQRQSYQQVLTHTMQQPQQQQLPPQQHQQQPQPSQQQQQQHQPTPSTSPTHGMPLPLLNGFSDILDIIEID